MIKSFGNKLTARFWQGERVKYPAEILRRTMDKLYLIENSTSLEDLRIPPSNHLESLKGHRLGQHSIRINNQWRICFRWESGDAYDVEITDYH